MESAADGIFIIDAQKQNFPVIYANKSFQKMTGFAKREILGLNYFLLYGADADSRILEKIKQTIHRGKSFYGEMLNFQKKGKKYFHLLRITPVCDAYGAVTHYVGIQTDVTLIRERELEIDEQREELLHVTRVGKLAEFVSSLAHEISQPLTAILSYAQAAQRMLAGREPELQKILSYIIKDFGCGIPAHNLSKLFSHFFTSKPDGLGMGLAISRSIIDSHGGRLDAENNPDRGATFYFTIPVDKKDA